jgi:hypothetical protein
MDKPIPEAVSVTLHQDRAGCEWIIVTSKDHPDSESEVTPSDDPALFDLLKALTAAQQPDHIVDATKMVAQQQGQVVACGGCGNADPEKVCIGCLHPFAAPPSAPVGVEEWQCRCGLRGPHSSFVAHADCPLRPAHALAQQPAAVECPHRTRCDCLASCKYGHASDGATQHQEPTTCKHDFRRDEDHGGACCQLCGEVRQ